MIDNFLEFMPSYFRLAKNSLYLSNCRTRVAAVISKKKPLIVATNKTITHPKYVTGKDFRTSIHAEINCCLHLSDEQADGAVIYVYRETKAKEGKYRPAMAKPCAMCRHILKQKGIKKVYYSISEFPYWRVERIK